MRDDGHSPCDCSRDADYRALQGRGGVARGTPLICPHADGHYQQPATVVRRLVAYAGRSGTHLLVVGGLPTAGAQIKERRSKSHARTRGKAPGNPVSHISALVITPATQLTHSLYTATVPRHPHANT